MSPATGESIKTAVINASDKRMSRALTDRIAIGNSLSVHYDARPFFNELGGARIRARLVTREPAASALVRPTHELHGVFDMPPGSGQFHLPL